MPRLFLALIFLGCATAPPLILEKADKRARENDLPGALKLYDRVAARKDARPRDQVQALLDGADVCDRMGDSNGARTRLERGMAIEAPGLTEKAMYYLAEHIRMSDRARALNLYYRAAASAERHGGGFPYKSAMDRIMQLSLSSP
jgi:hypothetical protein